MNRWPIAVGLYKPDLHPIQIETDGNPQARQLRKHYFL
jgi:hypothetical protein